MIRELARKLTAFEEFVGFVIVEVNFRRGKFPVGSEILKAHASMVFVRVSLSQAELLVKMIRPRKDISPALGCRIQSAEKVWRIFTASEVFSFAKSVGDKNKIHRINPPIVPALMILGALCEEFPTCKSIRLRFKNFITAGEPLTLSNDERLEIRAAGVRKITGEIL